MNQINIVPFSSIHISKANRIASTLTKMDQLLLEARSSNIYLSERNIDMLFYLAKNIILDYYLCKLENPNFTMRVVKQYGGIYVTGIGDENCDISLTDMQNNLNSIKPVIGDGNNIYDVDPIKKHKVTNFLLKVQHFDTIYKFSSDYFNQTFIFNAEYKSNTDIITQCLKRIPVGLENIGATCYMNATLQSFLNNPDTFDYFLFKKHEQFNNEQQLNNKKKVASLSYSFKKTLEDTHKANQNSVAPKNFRRTIAQQNPLFKKVEANDAKDLVNHILMTMHAELNKPQPQAANNNVIMNNNNNFGTVYQAFMQEFCCNFRSFISDIYYAVYGTISECLGCHNKLYNFQAYFFLVFPLEEVRKFRNQLEEVRKFRNQLEEVRKFGNQYMLNLGNKNMPVDSTDKPVTLNDCFLYNAKYEFFTAENRNHCNICKSLNDAAYTTKLVTVPKTLILLLNRGKGKQFNVKLEFTEYLDQYTIDKTLDPSVKWIYKRLSSVVTHLGESGASGHFVAHAISQTNGLRYLFNDATVSKDENFKKEVIDFGMPYLLFYTNMDPHDMLRFILNRVTYTEYRDSISDMFELLGPEQQSRFAYLLMRAADNDAIYNYYYNGNNLGCCYLSNLICATFELIKTGKSFDYDYMEECRIIICELEKQIKTKFSDAFSIDNIISLMNSNTFSMVTNKGEINYFKVHVVKSTCIKQSVINSQNKIINNDNIINQNFINNNQNNNVITNQNGSNKSLYSQNSKYDPYASESPKYNSPSKKSKLAWLKFALAVIFAIATIVLIVLELYLIALIPFVCMFAPFIIPKLCESCCGHVYTMDPLYENELDYNDNYPDNNKDYQKESPYSYNHNSNIIENNPM